MTSQATSQLQALKTHTIFPSFTEDLKSNTLTPLAYSQVELSKVLAQNASKSVLSKPSKTQRQFIAENFPRPKVYKPEEFKSFIETTFDVLDDAFYFGLLKKYIKLDIRLQCTNQKYEVENEEAGNTHAYYTEHWETALKKGARTPKKLCPRANQSPTIVVMLFHTAGVPGNKCPEEFNYEQMCIWVGGLLHEMLHGFFSIFSCACWKKCYAEHMDSAHGLGFTGHGSLFCETMEVVGKACLNQFEMEEIDCGVYDAAYQEIDTTAWYPTDDQISRWGLEREVIDRLRKRWAFFAAKGVNAVKDRTEKIESVLKAMQEAFEDI